MSLDHYVTLGASGLAVSPLCLGTMTFGKEWGWGSTVSESEAVFERYLERGGNFVDTANVYTHGHSEQILGDLIGRHPARRQRVVIATKFFCNLHPDNPNTGGSSRKAIVAACEESLHRLQTDYIDLYWMHAWDGFTPIEETLRTLHDLITAGKVRYVGFSNTPAWKVAQAQMLAERCGWRAAIAIQIQYSLLERTAESELIPMACELGLGVVPWSPLKGGVLTGKYTRENADTVQPSRGERVKSTLTEQTFAIIDVLTRLARELDTTPARVAIAWLQSRPGVASSIIGARTIAQLEDNLQALELTLSADQRASLDKLSEPALAFPAYYLPRLETFARGGLSLNGATFEPQPLLPPVEQRR